MEREKYIEFNTPSYAYLIYDNVEKLTLRKNCIVYAGEFLGAMNNSHNIYSSVSGRIIGSKKIKYNNSLVNALVIENNYKDKEFKIKVGKERFDFYKRKEANELFDRLNIEGKFNGKKYLMVDLTIKSGYLENKLLVQKYNYEILETIDAILTIFSIDTCYIAVNDSMIQAMLEEYSGIYPNIKFVSRVIQNEYSVFYNGYDIIRIYNALKFDKYYIHKFVTLMNKKESIIVKTKVDVSVPELLKEINISFSRVSVVDYNNNRIDDYDGILTKDIKTIIYE